MGCKKRLVCKDKNYDKNENNKKLKKWLVPVFQTILPKTWENLIKKSLQICFFTKRFISRKFPPKHDAYLGLK